MSKQENLNKTGKMPVTINSLMSDFIKIGIQPGMNLILHSSLRSLGWVCGGEVSVIKALEEVLTESGTLVMPTHSGDLSDPAYWSNPKVPSEWWDTIRSEMPLFEKDITPTRGMGRIPECFRKQDGVVRSTHPTASFAAWGKNKRFVVQDTHFDFCQNEFSPLGRIYDLDGFILLLGVDYDKNTSFHLAEYLSDYKGKKVVFSGIPVVEGQKRIWKQFQDILYHDKDFLEIGSAFEREHSVSSLKIGMAEAKLVNQKKLVDFAVNWMVKNRDLG